MLDDAALHRGTTVRGIKLLIQQREGSEANQQALLLPAYSEEPLMEKLTLFEMAEGVGVAARGLVELLVLVGGKVGSRA